MGLFPMNPKAAVLLFGVVFSLVASSASAAASGTDKALPAIIFARPPQSTQFFPGDTVDYRLLFNNLLSVNYRRIAIDLVDTETIFDDTVVVLQIVCATRTGVDTCPNYVVDASNPEIGVLEDSFHISDSLVGYNRKATLRVRAQWQATDVSSNVFDSVTQTITVQIGFTPTPTPPTPTPTPPSPPGASPTPITTPTSSVPPGLGFGDPHYRTMDGMLATYLGTGDFVLMEQRDAAFAYHARHCLVGTDAGSSICAIAVRCSATAAVVELYAAEKGLRVVIGGKEASMPRAAAFQAQGFNMDRIGERVAVMCESGFSLSALVQSATGGAARTPTGYLDAALYVPAAFSGRVSGLLGNFDGDASNDIAYRHNTALTVDVAGSHVVSAETLPELDAVLDSWTVREHETLFTTPSVKRAEDGAATRRLLGDSKFADLRVLGTALCKGAGIPQSAIAACAMDFVLSGGNRAVIDNTITLFQMVGFTH